MHFMLAPVNEIFMINPRARHTFIQNIIKDIGFPPAIGTVISQLLDKDPTKRPTPAAIIEVLEREDGLSAPSFAVDGPEAVPRWQQDVREIVRHILTVATYERGDPLVSLVRDGISHQPTQRRARCMWHRLLPE